MGISDNAGEPEGRMVRVIKGKQARDLVCFAFYN